jgi:teichuronic acid biosynthesis glycosyltransferase TuaG
MLTSVSNDDNLTIVSIGLPVFNSEKTIADAIKTIINQSFENWELIISDNNSNDSTIKIIEKFTAIDENFFI